MEIKNWTSCKVEHDIVIYIRTIHLGVTNQEQRIKIPTCKLSTKELSCLEINKAHCDNCKYLSLIRDHEHECSLTRKIDEITKEKDKLKRFLHDDLNLVLEYPYKVPVIPLYQRREIIYLHKGDTYRITTFRNTYSFTAKKDYVLTIGKILDKLSKIFRATDTDNIRINYMRSMPGIDCVMDVYVHRENL